MVLEEGTIKAIIEVEVDKKSFGDGIKFARDTGVLIDQELKSQLTLNTIKFKDKVKDIKKQLKQDLPEKQRVQLEIDLGDAKSELTQAKRLLENLKNTGDATTSRLQAKFNATNAVIAKSNTILGRTKTAIKQLGSAIAAAFAVNVLFNFFKDATAGALEFEKALARINTVAKVGDKELKALGKDIQQISKDYGIAQDELANTAFNISSAGVEFGNIAPLLELSARTAIAASTDTETAFNGIISVIKGYGLNLQEAGRVSDVFFKINELGQTTVGEVAASIGKVATLASNAGVSLNELSTIYSTLTGVTGNAAQVTDQTIGIINALSAPTQEAGNAMKALGIEYGAAVIEQKGLVEVAREVFDAVDGDAEALRRLVPEIGAMTAITALATSQNDAFNSKLNEVEASTGALNVAFQEMAETQEFETRRATAAFEVFKTKIGTFVADFILPAIGKIREVSAATFTAIQIILINARRHFELFGTTTAKVGGFFKDVGVQIGKIAQQIGKAFETLTKKAKIATDNLFATLTGGEKQEQVSFDLDFSFDATNLNKARGEADLINAMFDDTVRQLKEGLGDTLGDIRGEGAFDEVIIQQQAFGSAVDDTTKKLEKQQDKLGGAGGGTSEITKAKEKEIKDLEKLENDAAKEREKREKESAKITQEVFEETFEAIGKAITDREKELDGFTKAIESSVDKIAGIDEKIAGLGTGTGEDLSSRFITVEEDLATETDFFKKKALQEELDLIKQNTTAEERKEAVRKEGLSETEKILEARDAELATLEAQKLAEQALLDAATIGREQAMIEIENLRAFEKEQSDLAIEQTQFEFLKKKEAADDYKKTLEDIIALTAAGVFGGTGAGAGGLPTPVSGGGSTTVTEGDIIFGDINVTDALDPQGTIDVFLQEAAQRIQDTTKQFGSNN